MKRGKNGETPERVKVEELEVQEGDGDKRGRETKMSFSLRSV